MCSVVSNSLWDHELWPPGSCVHGTFQARILERAAIAYSRGCSHPRDRTSISCVSCIGRQILYYYATWEASLATKRCKKTKGMPMLKPSYPQGSIMCSGLACHCWRQTLLMDVLSEGNQKFPAAYTNCLVTKQSHTSPLEKISALTNEPNFLGWFLAAAKRLPPKGLSHPQVWILRVMIGNMFLGLSTLEGHDWTTLFERKISLSIWMGLDSGDNSWGLAGITGIPSLVMSGHFVCWSGTKTQISLAWANRTSIGLAKRFVSVFP